MREDVRHAMLGFLLLLLIQALALFLRDQGLRGIANHLEPPVGVHAFARANPESRNSAMPVKLGLIPSEAHSPEPSVILPRALMPDAVTGKSEPRKRSVNGATVIPPLSVVP